MIILQYTNLFFIFNRKIKITISKPILNNVPSKLLNNNNNILAILAQKCNTAVFNNYEPKQAIIANTKPINCDHTDFISILILRLYKINEKYIFLLKNLAIPKKSSTFAPKLKNNTNI